MANEIIIAVLSFALANALIWAFLWGRKVGEINQTLTSIRKDLDKLKECTSNTNNKVSESHNNAIENRTRILRLEESHNSILPDCVNLFTDIREKLAHLEGNVEAILQRLKHNA